MPAAVHLGMVWRLLGYMWNGPSDLPRSLRLEWRFVSVRWIGIIFMAPGLPLTGLEQDRLMAAYGVLLGAAVYNSVLQWALPRKPELFGSGYLTSAGDALLNIAMVSVGGGFDSPFYYILFTVTISAAMRYGLKPSMTMVAIFIALDGLETISPLARPLNGAYVFRSGFLVITGLLASYLREQAARAEAALEGRLLQARLLNEATEALGASLEYDTVLAAIASAAAHLLGSRLVMVLPHHEMTDEPAAPHLCGPDAEQPDARVLQGLTELCEQTLAEPSSRPLARHTLPWSPQPILVCSLALHERAAPVGTLAAVMPDGEQARAVGEDVLASFVERITLALENAALYRRLASRSTDLQRAYSDLATAHDELLTLDKLKTNFLANVSHELRTPLTSIRAFSEMLLTYDDPETRTEFSSIINTESERLTRLVNDLLDLTKIESGHVDWNMAELNLSDLLGELGRNFRPIVEQDGLFFEQRIAPELMVTGDRDRLVQVITNLLNNATKFTPSGGISLEALRDDDGVRVVIADTGIGLAEEDLERVFEKFQQVGDTLTSKPQGTGLGLAICRDIVQHHEGRIWVESTLGLGSRFIMALPAARPVPIAAPDSLGTLAVAPTVEVLTPVLEAA